MGCRLILNLCRVYYHPGDVTIQVQSIWAASEGIRFKPPTLTTETSVTEGELGPLSSMPPINPAGSVYELCDVGLGADGTKGEKQ